MLPPHIQQTLDALQGEIDARTVARAALLALYAQAVAVTELPPPVVATPGPLTRRKAAPVKPATPKRQTPPPTVDARRVGQWDGEVLDALTMAPPLGITATDIARRLVRNPADKAALELMVQRVWTVLQKFMADGRATKDGRYYRRAEAA